MTRGGDIADEGGAADQGDMTQDAGREAKRAHRERARAARRELSAEARAAASRAIASRALELPEVSRARSVLAYAALPEEADPSPLIAELLRRGARIALPRVCGPATLALHWMPAGAAVVPGPFGIAEPRAESETASVEELDLVLVPGVAFDESCSRLGFGGGYYDTLLAELPAGVPTVGLALDEQLCGPVPTEDHDAPMDFVVTPSAVFRRDQE